MDLMLLLMMFCMELRTSLLSRLWHYAYRGEGITNFTSIKNCEWLKRPCLPNGSISFGVEKNITSCGKGTGYINNFLLLFVVVNSWQMKTNGKNLHNTLESMIDLNHLWIARLHKRWLLIQNNVSFYLAVKDLSLNWDRNKTETIWKWVNDQVTLRKDNFVHIFNSFPFRYHVNHTRIERSMCFLSRQCPCLFPVWFLVSVIMRQKTSYALFDFFFFPFVFFSHVLTSNCVK